MNFSVLQPFLEKAAQSSDLRIKKASESLMDQMMGAQETEEVQQPTLQSQEKSKPLNNKPKDQVDQTMGNWMPDIAKPDPDASEFGKAASAYTNDIAISDLPKDTQKDIFKFVTDADKTHKVVQYGMTVSDLLPKVDKHNYDTAIKHIATELNTNGKKAIADKFQSKVGNKYILLLNDRIIDGHHFLSIADKLGISCSLRVLDLTPIRFEKSASSLFDIYVNHRR